MDQASVLEPLQKAVPTAQPKPLSVLHISFADNMGGSARSAYRVHLGLKRLGVRSRMLVNVRSTDDADVALLGAHRLWIADRLFDRLWERCSLQYLWYPSSALLPFRFWVQEADVIQLYNTHGGYFSHTVLPQLSRRRPVVWRLSDMWPMTGHCVYAFDCERWKTGCGSCPIVGDYPALRHDRTALLWRIKQRVYQRSHVTIVSPSRWLAHLAKQSPLLGQFPIHVIPNGLDTQVFHPIDKKTARHVLGLDLEKRIILFGSHFASDARKGARLVSRALERLAQSMAPTDIQVVVIGRQADQVELPRTFAIRRLGAIHDDHLLATVYAAADLFVLPTLADNLPNSVIESMACGTPVVSFGVGGVPEVIHHLETGYLARPTEVEDLANGLTVCLSNPSRLEAMGCQGRLLVEQDYSLDRQAQRFVALYRQICSQFHTAAHAVT